MVYSTSFSLIEDIPAKDGRLMGVHYLRKAVGSTPAVAGAIETAKRMPAGIAVTLLPDRGDRYPGTALSRSVCASSPP